MKNLTSTPITRRAFISREADIYSINRSRQPTIPLGPNSFHSNTGKAFPAPLTGPASISQRHSQKDQWLEAITFSPMRTSAATRLKMKCIKPPIARGNSLSSPSNNICLMNGCSCHHESTVFCYSDISPWYAHYWLPSYTQQKQAAFIVHRSNIYRRTAHRNTLPWKHTR